MADPTVARQPQLPRGRHRLTRAEVADAQRARMMLALTEAMGEKGYAATSVADVVGRAGVSRQTFYEQFGSKLDCFLASFDTAGDLLLAELATAAGPGADTPDEAPRDRFDRLLARYLDTLATWSGPARVLLVECHAAGPEGVARRGALQDRIAEALVELFGVTDDRGRFACTVLVAAVASLVTGPLVRGDTAALRALHDPVVDLVGVALATREAGVDAPNVDPAGARPSG